VSGVGHEIDFTIADLVADQRAPTPSGAAEIVAPDRATLQSGLLTGERRATQAMQRRLEALRSELLSREQRLRREHPETVLRNLQQRTDELTRLLHRSLQRALERRRRDGDALAHRLVRAAPRDRIAWIDTQRSTLERRLAGAVTARLARDAQRLGAVSGKLHAVSPLATLERGYAIVRTGDGQVLRRATDVAKGDTVSAQLADGHIEAIVSRRKSG
jgi:exodeoxyribonuclease VII large subunit